MSRHHYTERKSLAGMLCLLMLAAPLSESLAQTVRPQTQLTPLRRLPAEPGANAFASINRDEQGHSLANSYLLAMVSHYMYPHAYAPNPGNNFVTFRNLATAKFELWGMRKIDIRSAGNVQYAVMSDPNVIILAFRGSDAVDHMDGSDDWIATNAMAISKKVSSWGTVPFTANNLFGQEVTVRKEPGMHTGITNAYWTVRNEINNLILAHGGRSKKLFITGHSLGAGFAIIAAIDQGYASRAASRRFVAQGVYTFGGPRVGNGIFKKLYDSKRSAGAARALNTHRYVNFNDIVAMLPGDTLAHDVMYVPISHYGPGEPHNNVKYTHVGRTSNIRQNGTIALNSPEYRGIGSPLAHHSSLYAHHIYQAHVAGKSWASRMPPPPAPRTM